MPKIISCKSTIKKFILLILIIKILGYPLYCDDKEETKLVEIGLSPDLFEIYTNNNNEKFLRPKHDKQGMVYKDIVINKTVPYNLDFNNLTFKGKVILHRATFQKKIYFLNAKFEKDSVFTYITCKGAVYFVNVFFESDVSFYRSLFEEETTFDCVEFHKNVIFNQARFGQNTYFSKNWFNHQTDFSYTRFAVDKILDFTDSRFYGVILFYKTSFPGETIFNNVFIYKEIDLTSIDDKSSADICYIDLYGATIDKTKLSYEKFRVYFDDAKDLSFDQKNHVYLKLLSKQKNDGFVNSHKKLDLEYRKFYHFHGSIIKKIMYHIKKIWWNFGYNKERIFIIAMILLLVFSFINYWKFGYLIKVYPVDNIKKIIEKRDKKSKKNFFRRILSAVKYFTLAFYFTGSIFFGLKMPIGKFDFSKPMGVAYILFINLSGLICAAYMFNFIISI